jgi:hypothetical protein
MMAEAALLVALTVEHGAGTAACSNREALSRAVELRLRRRVFVPSDQAQLRLRVVFAKRAAEAAEAEAEIEARIELANPDGRARGSRSLVTHGHCSALDDSLALSVALLVDEPPEPEEEPAAPAAADAPLTPAPKQPSRVITIPPEVAAPREPWHAYFGASARGAWGLLPGVRPALALHLVIAPQRFWPIKLQGVGFLPTTAERDDASGARFRLLRAGLALCPTLWERPGHELGLCVGRELGWLTVEGYGFDHDAQEQRLNYALSLGGEGRLRLLGPVSVRAFLGAEVPLVRDRFTSGGRNAVELFEQAPLAVSGEIGLEATLW